MELSSESMRQMYLVFYVNQNKVVVWYCIIKYQFKRFLHQSHALCQKFRCKIEQMEQN